MTNMRDLNKRLTKLLNESLRLKSQKGRFKNFSKIFKKRVEEKIKKESFNKVVEDFYKQ